MLESVQSITQPEIIYPDTDGKPIANNTEQFHWIVVIEQNLEWLFADDPNVFIAGDLFWYPVEGKPQIVTAPDVMIVFDRPKGKRGSYQQWKEAGVAPQVVFEILSPSNSQDEMDRKLLFYERYGVEEYYIYNPDNNQLRGWLRDDTGLDIIISIEAWVSPRLGIRFELSESELKLYQPDGTPFSSYVEIGQLLEQERQRAETERQRAEQAETDLQNERQRSQLLAQRLREMGINPDELT